MDHILTKDWPDSIAFDRLHALALCGYRPKLGIQSDGMGFSRIDLAHPRSRGRHAAPSLTLWSNGILATTGLLWPERYAPREEGPPEWQKFIDTGEAERFEDFVESIASPSFIDGRLRPFVRNAKVVVTRLSLGASLCVMLGLGGKILVAFH